MEARISRPYDTHTRATASEQTQRKRIFIYMYIRKYVYSKKSKYRRQAQRAVAYGQKV